MGNNLVIIVLIGPPCSGKTTWIEEMKKDWYKREEMPLIAIGKDYIRQACFNKITLSKFQEKVVDVKFAQTFQHAIDCDNVAVIIDNCNISFKHIDSYLITFKSQIDSGKVRFYVKTFHVPYWKLVLRNFRRFFSGKWVPLRILKSFYLQMEANNFEEKYKDYLYDKRKGYGA